jgi:signal transduction histidine kinase
MRFDMAVQPLRPLLDQAIAATQAYAAQYGVSFALEVDVECRVRADADRIIQVMINLLSNAAKYSHFGTIVRVRLAETEGEVRVSVIDRGEGIPEEFHDRIFQRFAQADGSDSRKKSGTGLGLSICKAIIEKHRGHISFRSTPGVGSEFYFELPVVEESREIAA